MSIIRLTTCNNIIEANMVKHMLENEEIECFLTNDNFTTLMPGFNGILGAGIQIMIEEKDLEKAKTLLSIEENTEIINCPNCNSENISFGLGENRIKKVFFAILSVFISTPMSNIKSTYYCKNCKQDFIVHSETQSTIKDN
jgi:Zn finger protein HypA/HybF involved in hydrogenase expression